MKIKFLLPLIEKIITQIFKRDEKIEDGREAFLYYHETQSAWLITHGDNFYSKNGASWFLGKTEGLKRFDNYFMFKFR